MKQQGIQLSDAAFYKLAFAFSVCMLVLIATIYFRQLQDVNDAQNKVIASRDRQIELERLFSFLKDAERMQRGYIITGEVNYLSSYNHSKNKVNKSITCLNGLANNKSLKRKDLNKLKDHIFKRLTNMDQSLVLSRLSPHEPAFLASLQQGSIENRKIEHLINKIISSEKFALHQYEAFHKAKNNSLPYTTGFLVLFALIIFFISFYKISRDSARLRSMNENLQLVNKSFQYAEEIAEMGHWKRNLTDLTIEASDNMYRLFASKPGEFNYSEDMLMQFVHPEDKAAVQETLQKVRHEHLPPNLTYRIIRKDGQTRYFRSVGKLLKINNFPMLLGVTFDVTKQVENNLYIEQKNRELEALVEELASFNHIASHDLQEPLRKIQMFISRIATEEANKLSPTGLEYFQRVSASAERMEQLIDDLLLYSETSKADHVFETVALNELAQEAINELSAEIEAKKASVSFIDLPTLPVIPFQIRQLFINLIGNALKYSVAGKPPVVKMFCILVKAKETPEIKNAVTKNYYKIVVTDNGIGFKQEFAEKIFVLFQRLHKKDSYSGTGIGLAICKKIVENHNGYITATSTPGEGASFNIFLPK